MTESPGAGAGAPDPAVATQADLPGEPPNQQAAAASHRAAADAAFTAALDAADETDRHATSLSEAAQAIRDKAVADRDHMHGQAGAVERGETPEPFPQAPATGDGGQQ